MSDPVDPAFEAWQLAANVGNVLVAGTAVFLLGQGLADRRAIRANAERAQASKIFLSIRDNFTGSYKTGGKQRQSRTILLRNDSDLPVMLNGCILLRKQAVVLQANDTEKEPLVHPDPIELTDTLLRPGGEIEETDEGLGWDYAHVSFSDSTGSKWTRLSRDGELYKQPGRLPWRALVFQTFAQLPILTWLLAKWPEKYIMWRFKRRDAVPLSARIYRWLWGYVPIGEPEAWEMPQGAKAQDWPYVYMLSAGRLYRNTGRRALNWYAVIFGLVAVAALLAMSGD